MWEAEQRPVLLACSHGTRSAAGQQAVAGLVHAVAVQHDQVEVRAAYVDVESPSVPAALAELTGRRVIVVPLLLSAGYHVHVDLAAAVAGMATAVLAKALGPDPALITLLAQRLVAHGDDQVILGAAGSSDPRAVSDCELLATQLGKQLGRAVTPAYLSAASPTVAEVVAQAHAAGRRAIVANYLLAPGFFTDLLNRQGADHVTAPLLSDTGAPPPALVDLVWRRYSDALLGATMPESDHDTDGEHSCR